MCRCPYWYFYGILVFLRYTGILMVCRFAGIKFLLDIDTGMTKIPSFQFFCGISPSSNTYILCTYQTCTAAKMQKFNNAIFHRAVSYI